jgi:hypothetical protein
LGLTWRDDKPEAGLLTTASHRYCLKPALARTPCSRKTPNSKALEWREQERRSWQSDGNFPRLTEAVSGHVVKRNVFRFFKRDEPNVLTPTVFLEITMKRGPGKMGKKLKCVHPGGAQCKLSTACVQCQLYSQALTPLVEGIIGKDMERFREYAMAQNAAQKQLQVALGEGAAGGAGTSAAVSVASTTSSQAQH